MKAVHITAHGAPSVLKWVDVETPEPKAGEVLVRVLGASINHLDLWVRRGLPGMPIELPRIPGCDGTGEIVEVGAGVDLARVGERVVIEPGMSSGTSEHDKAGNDHLSDDYGIRGEHSHGIDCEYVALPARYVFPLPAEVDPVLGAAVPLAFLTAWGMLITRAALQRGETCLVLGGASGVGSAAIQVARDLGARVLSTAGTDEKRELCRALGADAVFDHGDPDWGKAARAATKGRGADVVVEHIGPATWNTSLKVLGRLGRLVTCGGTTGSRVDLQLPHLFIKHQTVMGSTMGPRHALRKIFAKVAQGVYKPVVDRVMPMSRAAEAHALLEGRKVLGKIVLTPDGSQRKRTEERR